MTPEERSILEAVDERLFSNIDKQLRLLFSERERLKLELAKIESSIATCDDLKAKCLNTCPSVQSVSKTSP